MDMNKMKLDNNKTFIFRYDPYFSPRQMFTEFGEAIHGKKYIQPENVMMANDLAVIHQIISKARLELFACLKEKQPKNIQELASLLHQDYGNVANDCQILANCGIIKLEGKDKEIQPIALYEQIVLDFPTRKISTERENFNISSRPHLA
jgi:predicted transcriptional regulator